MLSVVSNIVLCFCYPGRKNYSLLGCSFAGFDILCIIVVEIGNVRYVLISPLLSVISLGGHPLKSKW